MYVPAIAKKKIRARQIGLSRPTTEGGAERKIAGAAVQSQNEIK